MEFSVFGSFDEPLGSVEAPPMFGGGAPSGSGEFDEHDQLVVVLRASGKDSKYFMIPNTRCRSTTVAVGLTPARPQAHSSSQRRTSQSTDKERRSSEAKLCRRTSGRGSRSWPISRSQNRMGDNGQAFDIEPNKEHDHMRNAEQNKEVTANTDDADFTDEARNLSHFDRECPAFAFRKNPRPPCYPCSSPTQESPPCPDHFDTPASCSH